MNLGQRGGKHSHQQEHQIGGRDLREADDEQGEHGPLVCVEGEEPPDEVDEGHRQLPQAHSKRPHDPIRLL